MDSGRLDYGQTVASLWKQDRQSKNVQAIADRGGRLYDKFAGLFAALEALKKNPMVAQLMPDGTTVVIPGSTEDDGATPKSKRDQELETTANAFEQAKKDYIQ